MKPVVHRLSRQVGTGAAAVFLVLWIEQRWAAHHDFPSFPDFDPSGVFGVDGLPERSIVLLGDSTITGPGLRDPSEIWIHQMLPELTARYSIRLQSHAVGGARVHDVLTQQVPRVTDRYDLALVSAGANDALRGMTEHQMSTVLRQITEQLLEHCRIVILAGAGDIGTAPRLPFPLSAIATARARAAHAAHRIVADESERVACVPMWELTTDRFRAEPDLFSPDRFHPNRRGHAIWAEAALPTLLRALAAPAPGEPPPT